jgi:myo-inositol 2-dehydrogenase / D-chiro-inositol 1-dehydrogenase
MIESTRQSFRGVSLYRDRQVHRDGMYPGWFERIEQSYYEAIDLFLKAVQSKNPPSPSLEDGLKAQLIADKATESMRTGQPVKIPT